MNKIELETKIYESYTRDTYLNIMSVYREIETLHKENKPLYVMFKKGDREGSIGKLKLDKLNYNVTSRYDSWEKKMKYHFHGYFSGEITWDGRKNKVKSFYPHELVWLKDYDGPTVYILQDIKKQKEEILKNVQISDVHGNELSVGDSVIYINARYGQGMILDTGVIDRLETDRRSIFVIVKNEKGVESKIEHYYNMIMKHEKGYIL